MSDKVIRCFTFTPFFLDEDGRPGKQVSIPHYYKTSALTKDYVEKAESFQNMGDVIEEQLINRLKLINELKNIKNWELDEEVVFELARHLNEFGELNQFVAAYNKFYPELLELKQEVDAVYKDPRKTPEAIEYKRSQELKAFIKMLADGDISQEKFLEITKNI